MKKRIISLILVVALAVLTLVGCAYNYESADLTKFATFNTQKFLDAIQSLKIKDADFGTDESVRADKVNDAILTTLVGLAPTDKLTEGVPEGYDTLYYCYYCTYEKDGQTYYLYMTGMQESKAIKLQPGLTTNTELNEKIIAAIKDGVDFDARVYKTSTSGKAEAGDIVVVTYQKSYVDSDDKKITTNVTKQIITLPSTDEDTTFADKLIGEAVGSTLFKDADPVISEDVDGTLRDVTYTNVKIDWVIDDGMNSSHSSEFASVNDITYGADDNKTKEKDIFGKEHDLTGVELTYHIFPVYYIDVEEELTAELLLKKVFASSLRVTEDTNDDGEIASSEKATLEVFDDAGYKNGDKTLPELIKKLIELHKDLSSKDSALSNAQSTLEEAKEAVESASKNGGTPTKEQTEAVKTAESAVASAEADRNKAEAAVDDQIQKILGAVKKDGEDIAQVIVSQYWDLRYEGLENSYKNSIKNSLAKEIYAIAQKCITFNKDENGRETLPTQAVNEAYKRILNNYKYTFYEGNYKATGSSTGVTGSTGTTVSNYKAYSGDFNRYLKEAVGLSATDSMQKAYDIIGAEAEASVKDVILVYMLADVCNEGLDGSVNVTGEDISKFKSSINYLLIVYQGQQVEESDYRPALQLNNVLNFLLEEKDVQDNKVQYVRVSYTFEESED